MSWDPKLNYCKHAHIKKDEIMSMLENGEPITDTHVLHYLLYDAICRDNVMEMQRTVWNQANAAVESADGVMTIRMPSDDFTKMLQSHGKSLDKAAQHAFKIIESMKISDPVKYQEFMSKL